MPLQFPVGAVKNLSEAIHNRIWVPAVLRPAADSQEFEQTYGSSPSFRVALHWSTSNVSVSIKDFKIAFPASKQTI